MHDGVSQLVPQHLLGGVAGNVDSIEACVAGGEVRIAMARLRPHLQLQSARVARQSLPPPNKSKELLPLFVCELLERGPQPPHHGVGVAAIEFVLDDAAQHLQINQNLAAHAHHQLLPRHEREHEDRHVPRHAVPHRIQRPVHLRQPQLHSQRRKPVAFVEQQRLPGPSFDNLHNPPAQRPHSPDQPGHSLLLASLHCSCSCCDG
mmetsp:Transcript_34075/g.70363  ORF Transcript_34075/g.70363 Transcript_34075/m.70363 type:complete len:205 (+) Transcript_34075:487-1101(+)